MSRFNEVKVSLEELFRQRMEEVQVGEFVSVLGTKKRLAKPRILVLCRPLSSSSGAGGGTLNIVSNNNTEADHMKVKQAFAVDRLVDVTHDGSYDATFNFGASGMLSVSFESHIQREMFIAAVRRMQGDAAGGRAAAMRSANDNAVIRGVLSAAIGAEVEADAASRVRKLRQEKRRVFSTDEEQHLLKYMDTTSFDDIKGFQEVLLSRQKEAELTALDRLVVSTASWDDARAQVLSLVGDVEELEGRIEDYSTHLMSRKSVVQEIEHSNNTLRCKQQNLEKLFVLVSELREQLSLSPNTLTLLRRLRVEKDDRLVDFFAEGSNAQTLSEAMRHMQVVLHNPKLDTDYPIAAVAERKAFFVEQRRMIAQRSQLYIAAIIEKSEGMYLSDKSRFSRDERLVWRLHSSLHKKLLAISDIIKSLPKIDMEAFMRVLRKYRTSMQKVYALEASRFFKGVRKQVKKVHPWKGPFQLGSSESFEQAIATRVETSQAGETPRMWRSTTTSPAPSPALTPRLMRADMDDDRNSRSTSVAGGGGGGDDRLVSVEFPMDPLFEPCSGVEIFGSTDILRRLDAKAASSSVVSAVKSLAPSSTSGGGHLRPDIAFALAMQSAVMCILEEEYVLRNCFDVLESNSASDAEEGQKESSAADNNAEAGTAGRSEEESAALLRESLLELFGGGKAVLLSDGPPLAAGGKSRAHSRTNSNADVGAYNPASLGLPPRYPAAVTPSSMYSMSSNPTAGALDAETSMLRRNFLCTELVELAHFFATKCDRIYAVPILCMIRAYQTHPAMLPSTSSFCRAVLAELSKVVSDAMMAFVAEQTESITRCRKKYLIKPTALLHCFSRLPAFILRMEAVHDALSPNVCDRSEYASIASSLVNQSFEALDYVTNIRSSTETGGVEVSLSLNELIRKKVNYALEGTHSDVSSLKRGFIQQYRHHAFFCAFYATLPSGSFATDLLADHYESCKTKRDRYEELYLTRVLLVKDFPNFGVFALSAEDLSLIYSKEELRHHRALAPEAVKKIIDKLEKELQSGVRSSAARIKRHFLQNVDASHEESFHRTLLQRTWQHFTQLLLQKFDFLTQLLQWPMYQGMPMPVARADVVQMLSAF